MAIWCLGGVTCSWTTNQQDHLQILESLFLYVLSAATLSFQRPMECMTPQREMEKLKAMELEEKARGINVSYKHGIQTRKL